MNIKALVYCNTPEKKLVKYLVLSFIRYLNDIKLLKCYNALDIDIVYYILECIVTRAKRCIE